MRKKIYVDATPLVDPNVSGIGHVTLEIVRKLALLKRYKVILIIPRRTEKMLDRWKLDPSIKARTIPLPTRVINGLTKYNLMPPVDLFLGRGVYLFPNFRNWPVVFSRSLTYIHDVAFVRHPHTVAKRNQQMLERKVPEWIRRTDCVITVSNHAKSEIEHFFPDARGKTHVVYNGIDLKTYVKQDKKSVESMKKKIGIHGDYLLYLGNIEPRKNLSRLLDGYMALPKSLKEKYSLIIVGGHGWNNEEIIDKIHEAQYNGERIILPNSYIEDEFLPALYSGASLLVHVAIYEGFGVSPLQSLACETPVVVSNTSSLPEVVGDCGVFCDPNDTKSITKAIEAALTKDSELTKHARSQATKFSWEKSIASLEALINGNTSADSPEK